MLHNAARGGMPHTAGMHAVENDSASAGILTPATLCWELWPYFPFEQTKPDLASET